MQFKDWNWSDEKIYVGFLAILVTGAFSTFAVGMQRRRVRLNKSAELLPFPAYFGQLGLFLSTLFYGINFELAALIVISPMRTIIVALLIVDIMRLKIMNQVDTVFMLVTALLIILSFFPTFTVIATATMGIYSMYYFAMIPVSMWRRNTRGSVSFWSMVAFCISQAIWIYYGISVWDNYIIISSMVLMSVPMAVLIIWPLVPPVKIEAPASDN